MSSRRFFSILFMISLSACDVSGAKTGRAYAVEQGITTYYCKTIFVPTLGDDYLLLYSRNCSSSWLLETFVRQDSSSRGRSLFRRIMNEKYIYSVSGLVVDSR